MDLPVPVQALWSRCTQRFKIKRCDPQSNCAQQAQLLVSELLKPPQRSAAFVLEPIPVFSMFSSKGSYEWARSQWLRLPLATRDHIWDTLLDDPDLHCLSQHDCSVVALETVREAARVLASSSGGWWPLSSSANNDNDDDDISTSGYHEAGQPLFGNTAGDKHNNKQQRMETAGLWLYALEIYLCNPPYRSTPTATSYDLAQKLEWYVHKHRGHGIDCLQALHKQRAAAHSGKGGLLASLLSA